ncbi:hypothetical protein L596_028440 [Steinernema carpocapsae]|uniref:non-specific serine/threonine protein kinase n=1 Tax=Steinernema carpocapsae TaxID=34508 RepID=A0A4U5LYI7_STECR|nr:hypothetical protein L596_028440 [Steinernema carpocapsae]
MQLIPVDTGTVIADRWEVIRKIGEGACGVVWEVLDRKNPSFHAALKIEARKEDLEMLKMEALVMRRLRKSGHFAKLYDTGTMPKFNYVVMKLLGPSISHLRKRCPQLKFTLSTSVRLTIQMINALKDLHDSGFVHRDVKPGNFVLGGSVSNRNTLFVLDFGLARIVKIKNDTGILVLRAPRNYVRFRGTIRFCSVAVHRNEEPGFSDDMWSVFYTFVEMMTGDLPWRGMDRSQVEECKSSTGRDVMIGCPKDTVIIYKHLRN